MSRRGPVLGALVAACGLLWMPTPASGHGIVVARLSILGGGLEPLTLRWQAPAGSQVPVFSRGARCTAIGPEIGADRAQGFHCPAANSGEALHITATDPAMQILLTMPNASANKPPVLLGGGTAYTVAGLADQRGLEAARAFFELGVRHVLGGADHLLFIAALFLLARGLRVLVAVVTVFTVGHSITLALAATGQLTVNPRVTETAIALTLIVAARQLWFQRDQATQAWRSLGIAALVFGLIHGLGFAGALESIGLPPVERLVPLAAFNMGVEAGQLVVVAALWALSCLAASRASAWVPLAARAASIVIGTAGFYWCLERV